MASILKPFLLNNGRHMPKIGLGTFQLIGDQCSEVVHSAVGIGYRMIDTAYSYGNEAQIGDAIKQLEGSGSIKREDLFIVSKVPPARLSPADVRLCVEESRENLKTKYLDLLLVHTPWALKNKGDGDLRPMGADGFYDYDNLNLAETWKAFEEVAAEGKVNSIGVSNFTEQQLRTVLKDCSIKPQVLQFECHAYYQQRALSQFCLKFGIHCMAYSPLGAPALPEHHRTEDYSGARLLDDPVVMTLAEKYQKTPAQILLRFLLQRNFALIPKASSLARLEENISISNFRLSNEDIETLKSLDKDVRYFTFPQYRKHPDFPKPEEYF